LLCPKFIAKPALLRKFIVVFCCDDRCGAVFLAGRGFIALAAAAMGRLAPVPTMFAALFFGFADALSNVLAAMSIPDEFIKTVPYISTVIGLIAFSAWRKRGRKVHIV